MRRTTIRALLGISIAVLFSIGLASAGASQLKRMKSETKVGEIGKSGVTQSTTKSAQPSDSPVVGWGVLSQGATHASSPGFMIRGTLVQTAIGYSSTPDNIIHSGFWQDFSASGYLCGDVNHSGNVDIDDIIYIVNYVFTGGPAPDPYEIADVNCADSVDIDDIIYLVNYIFTAGPEPCTPCK
jgi:hypothetical protein